MDNTSIYYGISQPACVPGRIDVLATQEVEDQVVVEQLELLLAESFFPKPPSPANRSRAEHLCSDRRLEIDSL